MELSRERRFDRSGLLYPMMVIAAIAVIVFSIIGIASIAGWLPSGLMSRATAAVVNGNVEVETARSDVFRCTECGVIESIRELERG
jgi:hypothetical protein